jgi:hypothetical protein
VKNILAFLGVAFLVFVLVAAALFGYFAYTGNKLDASSKAYVDEGVPAIVSTWSKAELVRRASPQLLQKISDDQVTQLFNTLSTKLGIFKSYDGAKGDSNVTFTTQNGRMVTASYIAKATFQYGKAEIQIKLIKPTDSWEILGFHVEMEPL